MSQCGRCHEKIADSYFDTYHGKVSQLGYTKTANVMIAMVLTIFFLFSNPKSHLSRENVVETCRTVIHPLTDSSPDI